MNNDAKNMEIFETSDLEDDDYALNRKPSNKDEPEVLSEEIDLDFSRSQFANNLILNTDSVNFSDSLVEKGKINSGYHVAHLQVTTEHRLARIERELEEIRIIKEANKSQQKDIDHIDKLKMMVQGLLDNKTPVDLSTSGNFYSNQQNTFNEIKTRIQQVEISPRKIRESKMVDIQSVLALEERINNIESFVGSSGSIETENSSIISEIRDLRRKIQLVHNPEYNSEVIKDRLTTIQKLYEDCLTGRKLMKANASIDELGDQDDTKNIKYLYKIIPRLREFNLIFSSVVDRLKSLNVVHADLANNIDLINSIDSVLFEMKTGYMDWIKTIEELNSKTEEMQSKFKNNENLIEKHISDLSVRISKLEP